MNELFIILIILIGSTGLMLYFVGWINSIFMALGKGQKIRAIELFLLNPTAIFYCLENWKEAKKHGIQLIVGLILVCATAIPSYVYIQSLI